MATRAIVIHLSVGAKGHSVLVQKDAKTAGVSVLLDLGQGSLVEGAKSAYQKLERLGYLVHPLTNTDKLQIGDHVIDIGAPRRPLLEGLSVPPDRLKSWRHFLVQLIAPSTPKWAHEIERHKVEIVSTISWCGLFVVGALEAVEGLRELPYVTWTGPFHPAYRLNPSLREAKGRAIRLSMGIYPAREADNVRASLKDKKITIVREAKTHKRERSFHVMIVEADAAQIPFIVQLLPVRWVEPAPAQAVLDGEREAKIVAEKLDPTELAPSTTLAYRTWLGTLGLSPLDADRIALSRIAICDSGVDAQHLDLRTREHVVVDYGSFGLPGDTDGHGTHVAGLAVGSAASGAIEGAFGKGLGVAPDAEYVTIRAVPSPSSPSPSAFWPPADFGELTGLAVANGAYVMNNSWATGVSPFGGPVTGYTAAARQFDDLVRDADPSNEAFDEPLVVVFSAGNNGGAPRTLTAPHEAKNVITVGASLSSVPGVGFDSEKVKSISGDSSRGPAADGRWLPTVVAPGTDVMSTRSTGAPGSLATHVRRSGTSMAAALVTGACSLLVAAWSSKLGRRPSPALVKALLVNGAEDLNGGDSWNCINGSPADRASWSLHPGSTGTYKRPFTYSPAEFKEWRISNPSVASDIGESAAYVAKSSLSALAALSPANGGYRYSGGQLYVRMRNGVNPGDAVASRLHVRPLALIAGVPNGDQGWGRVSLENMLEDAPASDRGPKLVYDQVLLAPGETWLRSITVSDRTRPLRVTLVWTDPPGEVNSIPARRNALHLDVRRLSASVAPTIYKGNHFPNKRYSTAGGNYDDLNNVQCVFLQSPTTATYQIRVVASSITTHAFPPYNTSGALQQDFAIVIDNARLRP